MVITPLPIGKDISSLSAILLNDAYYDLLKDGQVILDGIPVLNEECLIPFKVKAWLDLTERRAQGEAVDSRDIKKHKNDVFRLAQLLTDRSRKTLGEEVALDMSRFLKEMEKETIDTKAIGIQGVDQKRILLLLQKCYGLDAN